MRRRIRLALFKFRNELYLWAPGRIVSARGIAISHRRGLLISTLEIDFGDAFARYAYLTPWWRTFLDDGMFPEDRYPLERLTLICRDQEQYKFVCGRLHDSASNGCPAQ